MSGFEVVGVILGAIPIILSGINKYQSVRRFARELKTLKRGLQVEHLVLQTTCEKLLLKIVPVEETEAFIRNPLGPLWKTEQIQKSIRLRLWKSYRLFEETVQEMVDAVNELGQKFGLNLSTQVCSLQVTISANYSPWDAQIPRGDQNQDESLDVLERLRFMIRRSQFEGLLKTLEDGNTTLTKLLDIGSNRELEVARLDSARDRVLEVVRQSSKSVFEALVSSVSCECRGTHSLNLSLPLSSFFPTPEDTQSDIVDQISFRAAFETIVASRDEQMTLPFWQGLELRTVKWEQNKSPPTKMKAPPVTVKKTTGPRNWNRSPGPSEITDFCRKVAKWCGANVSPFESYGLVTSQSPLSKHTFRVDLINEIHEPWSGNSLETMLANHTNRIPEMRFSFRQKQILAAKIASSILQLSDSQWLPSFLTSADITFIDHDFSDSPEHPYVTRRLKEVGVCQDTMRTTSNIMRHPLTFSLGVVLIEVALGKKFDSIRQKSTFSSPTTDEIFLADYETATRQFEQVERAVGSNYADAVRSCINCEFVSPRLDLEESAFRSEVYGKVVAPLEKGTHVLKTCGF